MTPNVIKQKEVAGPHIVCSLSLSRTLICHRFQAKHFKENDVLDYSHSRIQVLKP